MKSLFKSIHWVWLLLPVLIWWAWRAIPLDQVIASLNRLTLAQISLFAFINFSLILLFSLRWWLLLREFHYNLPFLKLAAYRTASFAISILTPGPQFGGEPVQVYSLRNLHRVPDAQAVASVGLDKMIELLANFSFLAIGTGVILFSGYLVHTSFLPLTLVALLLLLMPVVYTFLLFRKRKPITWFFRVLEKWTPGVTFPAKLRAILDEAESQAVQLCSTRPAQFFWIWILSLSIWIPMVLEVWLTYWFLGAVLSLPEVIFLMTAARLALLFPLPGGMGVLEASQVLGLGFLGVNPAVGVGVMLLARARDFIQVGFGIVILFYLTRIKKDKERYLMDTISIFPSKSGGI